MKKIIYGIVIVVVVFIGYKLLSGGSTPVPEATTSMTMDKTGSPMIEASQGIPSPSASASQGVTTNEKVFTVTGKNFSFEPATLKVAKGDKVKIIFKNADGFHDLKIDEFNVATKRIKAGDQESIEFTADKTGAFEYYCSVGSHRAMGMKGTLTVQ